MILTKLPASSQRRHQRSSSRHSSMRLQLEDLESRVLLAGTPSQLIIQVQPTQTALGTPMFPAMQVAVADVTSATVTTDKSAVIMTIQQGPGGGSLTLNGTAVPSITVNAVNGVATFSNLNFTATGIYILNVNDGALAGTASNFFNVTAAAAKLALNQQPTTIVVGQPFSPAIAAWVEDAGGNLITSDRSAVSLSIVNGPAGGTLTGTTTVNAITGVATFNGVSLSEAGTYQLAVSDGSLTSATSNTFTVTAAGATKLVFPLQLPVTTPSGVNLPAVIVDVTDAGGNIVTTDNSAVTLALNTTAGALTGVTTINAVNGVATFTNLSLSPIGRYTLKATDGRLSTAVSNSYIILGDPANLVFAQQPVNTAAGTVLPAVIVDVTDAAGNIVTTDSSPVALAIGAGPAGGTLNGTTIVNAVNGVATFNDLSLSTIGTYTLTASDGALGTANSSTFIINGAAAQLAFLVQPSTTSINTAISPAVVVAVEDIDGNRVVNSAASITISVASGPGTLSGTQTVTASNGSASFSNLLLSASGTYTLAAASGALTGATSSSFVVLPPPSKVVFATQPSDVASGATMYPAVVVNVENAAGVVAPNDKSSVTLAVLSGPDHGTIGGTTTVAAVNGVATFSNLTFTVPGDYTLVVSDGALAGDTSVSFTVTQPPKKLQWILQPQYTIQAGATLPPMTVWLENRNNELVGSSHAVVTFTISSGPTGGSMTLNGATAANASTNANHGVATLSGLSFTKIGTYILNAASTGLTAAKSDKFVVVVAGGTGHLVMVSNPTSTLVGKTFTSNVVVKVADKYGNVISSDNSPVTLYLSVATGGILTGSTTVSANKGVATFGNLMISQAGSYVISASDATLPNATPTSFSLTVTPVISSVNKPGTASFYLAGTDFTLSTQLTGTASSMSPWTGTASLVQTIGTRSVDLPTTSLVTSGGKVSLAVAGQTAGTYTVRLMYNGDVNHLGGASQAFNLVVGKATTTKVSRTVTGTTLNLDVNVTASGTSEPTGIVQLFQNGAANATMSVNTLGHALFSLALNASSYTFTAVYEGDNNFRTSSSASFAVNIGLKSTTTISSPATTLGRGDTLTLTALVLDPAKLHIPTGNVQLLENGTLNQMVALNASASATITLTPTVGKHAYSFAYQGDSSYLVSASKTLNVTVGREATTLALTASATQSTFGTVYTLEAQVSANNLTTIARTGIVALKDGGNTIATLSLNSSSNATFSITPTAGTHAYTVTYLGDGNFATDTSASQTLNVAKDRTTITATPSATTISAGTILRIDARVTPVNATASVPTGVVNLQDGGVTVMTLTLDSTSSGTFWLTPSLGGHSYTLNYQGDGNFASTASSAIALTVITA